MTPELEALQGVWKVTSLELEGMVVPPMMLSSAQIAIDGEHFTTSGMGPTYKGNIEVDPTANPQAFNLNFTEGPEAGNASLGIYELDGNAWRICLTTRGGDRPKEFVAEPGTGIALQTLERAS